MQPPSLANIASLFNCVTMLSSLNA